MTTQFKPYPNVIEMNEEQLENALVFLEDNNMDYPKDFLFIGAKTITFPSKHSELAVLLNLSI